MERAGRLLASSKAARRCLTAEELAVAAWSAAVGAKAARHTRAVALEGKTLIVEAGDELWLRNLELLNGPILANLRRSLGEAAPDRIQYRLSVPRRPVRSEAAGHDFRLATPADDAARIEDPVLRRVYLKSKRKALAS
jgi:predicted nucleic acid-binding Zn ribbon protein